VHGELRGELRDQRQAIAGARAVGAGPQAAAPVAHGDAEVAVRLVRFELDLPVARLVAVGVQDDVRDCLADAHEHRRGEVFSGPMALRHRTRRPARLGDRFGNCGKRPSLRADVLAIPAGA